MEVLISKENYMSMRINIERLMTLTNEALIKALPNANCGSGVSIDMRTGPDESPSDYFGDDADLIQPGDIIIDYNWQYDEPYLKGADWLIFECITDNFFNTIKQRYEVVCEVDGSGNGLMYGAICVRDS
jgi:hypothetical protein